MKVRVLYFGIVKERLGLASEEHQLDDGATVAALMDLLAARHDVFKLGAGSLRVAVDREYVDSDRVLSDNAEVAIIPPVAGG